MTPPYAVEVGVLMATTKARAAYVLILGGDRGSAGCPAFQWQESPERQRALYVSLLEELKNCVTMVEADIAAMSEGG